MERDDDGERGSTVLSFSINGVSMKRSVFSGILIGGTMTLFMGAILLLRLGLNTIFMRKLILY
jgi:hypothetical protein